MAVTHELSRRGIGMSENDFRVAQQRMLARYGVDATSRFIEIPLVEGRAQVLVTGDGLAVVMLAGIGTPAAMWAPLMAELEGIRLHAIDLPGYGLTDSDPELLEPPVYRSTAVRFLRQALDALELERAAFVANSLGSLWTVWFALEAADRVEAMVHVGCPALCLGTSAPLPMRLLSVSGLARVLTRIQPPSPKQVEDLAKMVHEHPMVPELAELLLATERLPGFKETFLTSAHTLLRLRGARPHVALTADQLARVSQPTLFIWGDSDPMGSPAIGSRAAEIVPQAELQVVEAGHAPWLKRSAAIGPLVVDFLSRHVA